MRPAAAILVTAVVASAAPAAPDTNRPPVAVLAAAAAASGGGRINRVDGGYSIVRPGQPAMYVRPAAGGWRITHADGRRLGMTLRPCQGGWSVVDLDSISPLPPVGATRRVPMRGSQAAVIPARPPRSSSPR